MNILKENDKYFFYNDVLIEKKLKAGNYRLNFSTMSKTCWLEKEKNFSFPEKVYDFDNDMIDFIIKDFTTTNSNIGVHLTGSKGQGKSMTSKLICDRLDLPVILLTKKIPQEIDFISFLNSIEQPYILFIDEFEKLFLDKNNQDDIKYHTQTTFLSFMDGSMSSNNKILFLLTTNEKINDKLHNRPSRIKYSKTYDYLKDEVFHEVVIDKLINKDYYEDLKRNVSMFNLNIDLLINIIETINKFDKPFSSFKEFYNYSIQNFTYRVYKIIDNKEILIDILQLKNKVSINDTYIDGYEIVSMLSFDDNGTIKFQTFEYLDRDSRKEGEIDKNYFIVKMVLMNTSHDKPIEVVF